MFKLQLTKTEYTLNGVALDSDERFAYLAFNRNPDVVCHHTALFEKTFKTGKAAWAFATPELLNQYGLVWNGIGYSTEFASYDVNVCKVKNDE
jgi:hypothetical protein